MRKSSKREIERVEGLVQSVRDEIKVLLQDGKRVHIIWDFDGVLADSRSDDAFVLAKYNLRTYFDYEERLAFETHDSGLWMRPIAHTSAIPCELKGRFSQDIVTARSSMLSMRVHMFCFSLNLKMRWMLFIGHQPKNGAYRIILDSFKDDSECHIFCIDDSTKHIKAFKEVSRDMSLEDRTHGIIAPIIRTYTKSAFEEYFTRIMNATGSNSTRVRDPSNDCRGFLVLPEGRRQFTELLLRLRSEQISRGHHFELRQAFVEYNGEVGEGRFKNEDELEQAMREFIIGFHCP